MERGVRPVSQQGWPLRRRTGRGRHVGMPVVRWTYSKSVPYIASPLVLDGVLYFVQDGGIVTTVSPETGEVLHRGRLSRGGKKFYASPVAADGKVLLVDTEGRLTVLKAGSRWEELSSTELSEPCFATPAIYRGRVYADGPRAVLLRGNKSKTGTLVDSLDG